MISVVICSLVTRPEKLETIRKCVRSLKGADEIIVYAPTSYSDGFCKSWNLAASMAHGDYLVFVGDGNIQTTGNLKDLCVENTVTSPLIGGVSQEFWGFVFCVPKKIYKKYGLYDMVYNDGVHFMDEDLWRRYKKENVALKSVETVNFDHPVGGKTVNETPDFKDRVSRNLSILNERWKK